jgi:hypothetical protein
MYWSDRGSIILRMWIDFIECRRIDRCRSCNQHGKWRKGWN